MREFHRARLLAAGLIATLLLPSLVRAAAMTFPSDSIGRESWQLANGLRVVTLNVTGAQAVAITVVYPGGRDQDLRGNEGLSVLLGELQFTAAAGNVPERSRTELMSLRPLGYDIKVSRRYTAFTELASPVQFPGVLAQVAARMRGVNPTPEVFASALEGARRQLRAQFFSDPAQALYYEVRELASRADTASIRRLATGRGLERLTLRDVQPRLAAAFRASSAVMCIAGNLAGLPLKPLIENELGGLPTGAPALPPSGLPFGPGAGIEPRGDIDAPVGVIGVLAPALADTLHPAFYLSLLVMGIQANQLWGPPAPPLVSRFQYALFDDPDLVRFYPAADSETVDPAGLAESFSQGMGQISRTLARGDELIPLRQGVGWLLGGPPTAGMLRRIRAESGALNTLAWSTAVRELWGGEAFWSNYRDRFNGIESVPTDYWAVQLSDPRKQVRLLYRPIPK